MPSLEKIKIVDSLDRIAVDDKNPAVICSFEEASWRFDYYFHSRKNKKLYVFFPSALVRGKRFVPTFHRWSWSPRFLDADILCVSDPTLWLDPEILGGWFQGKDNDWVLLRVIKHIKHIQQKFDYQKITFCGSSLGGFAALQAGILAPSAELEKIECRVFSENPQICLPEYMWKSHLKKIAQVCYSVDDLSEAPAYSTVRLDIVSLIDQIGHIPQELVVVKESDVHHHQVHVNYLRENIPNAFNDHLKFEVIPNSVDATGHTALTIDEVLSRINIY